MRYLRYVLRRAAFAVGAVYAVVVVIFLLGTATARNEIRNALAWAADPRNDPPASEAELENIRESLELLYNLDQPLHERVGRWLVDVTTLDWGRSITFREPVTSVLDDRVVTTLEYVLPGLTLAVVLGVGLGVLVAVVRNTRLDSSVRVLAYALLGVPAFVLATFLLELSGHTVTPAGVAVGLPAVGPKTLAAITVALSLLAGQLRFARTATLEQLGAPFVRTLRAKGAGRGRLARHVLRNAAIPIVSLSLTDLLAVLVLDIYVIEDVLAIDGLAAVSLAAARQSDVPLLIWSTMVLVALGILGHFCQDVLHGYLDPRIHAE